MTETFTFHEVVIGIIVGDVKDGDEFVTSSGFKAVYKDGVLAWVTHGGYIGSPVAVTAENMAETFAKIKKVVEQEISFHEAVQLIDEGVTVRIDVDGSEYFVSDFTEFDELISTKEYFEDVYNGSYFVEVDETPLAIPSIAGEGQELTEEDIRYIEQELIPAILAELGMMPEAVEVEPMPETSKGKKLTEADAYNIHHKYHFVKQSVTDIADEYDITPRMVYYILDGTHWFNVYEAFHTDYDIVADDYRN